MVKRNDAFDYGLHLEEQTTPNFTLRSTRAFLELHDAVQRAANSSHQTTPHSFAGAGLNVWMVIRHNRLCAEKWNYYGRLFSFFFFPYIKEPCLTCWFLLFVLILTFHFLTYGCEFVVGTHTAHEVIRLMQCLWNCVNSAMLDSSVNLLLHFHSVRNLSVYTVCNSSICWCAGRIK